MLTAVAVVQLANELFGVTVEAAENPHVWHPDVKFFSLKRDGKQKAYFYLDPYSRPAGLQLRIETHLCTNVCASSATPACQNK